MLIPMGISGIVGTFCVISVNAWMNNPTGFTIRDGVVVDVNPWRAMFNDGVWLQFLHMWVGAFMLVGLVLSGVYAAGLLRGRTDVHHRLGFTIPFVFASVAAVVQPLIGHVLGLQAGARQPSKLSAFELALHDEKGPAALQLGGFLIGDEVSMARSQGSIRSRGPIGHPSTSRTGRSRSWSESDYYLHSLWWCSGWRVGVGATCSATVGSSGSPWSPGRSPSSRLKWVGWPPKSGASRGRCGKCCAPPTRPA
jgi:hypothetical protein